MRTERSLAFGLTALAVILRAAHAAIIDVPSNDGAHYLAMAEEIARGDWHSALECVLHPGSALLPAVLVRLGVDSFVAARLVATLAAGLTTLVLYLTARRLTTGAGALLATGLLVLSQAAIRLTGEAYSEPVFQLFVALGVLATLRDRAVLGGLVLGLSFWVRPEGLAFVPLLLLGQRRGLAVAIALTVAATLPLLRWSVLLRFTVTPLFDFMTPMGPLGEPDALHVALQAGRNLLALPVVAVSTLDAAVVPLGLLGLWRLRGQDRRFLVAAALSLLLGWAAMVGFQIKPRFYSSQWPLLLPLAAVACAWRPAAWLALCAALVNLVAAASDLAHPPRAEMRAELLLGHALRAEPLAPGELVTDLPRVAWAAGLHPPQPAVWGPDNLRPLLQDPRARVAVLGGLREGRKELMQQLATAWQAVPLPPEVAAADHGRLLLFRRR